MLGIICNTRRIFSWRKGASAGLIYRLGKFALNVPHIPGKGHLHMEPMHLSFQSLGMNYTKNCSVTSANCARK